MRINVYSQEIDLDRRPTVVSKETTDVNGDPITYHGVRIWLRQTEFLHHTPEDDDTSAITFWLPKSSFNEAALASMSFNEAALASILYACGDIIHDEIPRP